VARATYFSFSRTARMRARVINHLLIYGQILFKFAVNILQITKSSMDYVLFIFTHCAHACERMCTSGRMVKTFTYLWTDSFQSCWAHTTNDHKLHGLQTYHVHAPRASSRMINCSLTYERFLFKFAVNILQITIRSKGYVLFIFMHRAYACEGACASERVVKRSLISERILPKCGGDNVSPEVT
jgi:hypothetical protein